jgi:hypothetical protein
MRRPFALVGNAIMRTLRSGSWAPRSRRIWDNLPRTAAGFHRQHPQGGSRVPLR